MGAHWRAWAPAGAYERVPSTCASDRQWLPVVIKDAHAQDIAAQGGPWRPCSCGQSDHLSSILGSLSARNRSTRNAREDRRHWSPLVAPGCPWLPMVAHDCSPYIYLMKGVSRKKRGPGAAAPGKEKRGSGGGSPWNRKFIIHCQQPFECSSPFITKIVPSSDDFLLTDKGGVKFTGKFPNPFVYSTVSCAGDPLEGHLNVCKSSWLALGPQAGSILAMKVSLWPCAAGC